MLLFLGCTPCGALIALPPPRWVEGGGAGAFPRVVDVVAVDVRVAKAGLLIEEEISHQPVSQRCVAVVEEVLAARQGFAAVAVALSALAPDSGRLLAVVVQLGALGLAQLGGARR